VSVVLGEIRKKVERGHENGTLGNVQGNHLGDSLEKLNRIIAGGGILGNCLIYQLPFLSHSPLYSYQQKKKPSMDQGKPLPRSASWTLFIFPGQFLFSQDGIYFWVINICQGKLIHVHPTTFPSSPLFPTAARLFRLSGTSWYKIPGK